MMPVIASSILSLLGFITTAFGAEPIPQDPKTKPVKRGMVQFDADGRMRDDFSNTLDKWGLSEDARYERPANIPSKIEIMDSPGLLDRKAVRFFVPREPGVFRAEIKLRSERGYQERW